MSAPTPSRGRSAQPITDRTHAINYARACARNPRNRRNLGGGSYRVYYVLECHPLPCTRLPATVYMVTTWLGTDDEYIGYASTRDGVWHEKHDKQATS